MDQRDFSLFLFCFAYFTWKILWLRDTHRSIHKYSHFFISFDWQQQVKLNQNSKMLFKCDWGLFICFLLRQLRLVTMTFMCVYLLSTKRYFLFDLVFNNRDCAVREKKTNHLYDQINFRWRSSKWVFWCHSNFHEY